MDMTAPTSGRTVQGVLGKKLGMTQVFDANNRIVPVTVVEAGPCVVTQIRTVENDGYSAVQISYGAIDPRKVNKPEAGHFAKAGVPPRRYTLEIRTADASSYTLGQEISVDIFAATFGDGEKPLRVDVVATSKGKGYAGVFKGLGAGHGVHRAHRKPGSIGACATPGRVFKGTRMAGRMGVARTTTQNLTVHAIDAEKGLLLLKGAVPGPAGGLVFVRTAVKNGLGKGGVAK
jgi:large subunit ribosomal protein L3